MTIQEVIHTLSRRKGSNGAMIVKIDLKKAYDKVDWGYLSQVLRVTGFSNVIQELIMNIVTTNSLCLLRNGELLDSFSPSRDLRQGDPLSPYLFLLCMECLHQKISSIMLKKHWRLVQLNRVGSPLSHLFFADDLLLFGQGAYSQAKLMEHIIQSFCQESGQKVNRRKNVIWVSPNTPIYLRGVICSGLGVRATGSLGTYLGVPVVHGHVKISTYQYIINKVRKKLAG